MNPMKKNILYIIFFMSLIACKQEAIFKLEGHQVERLKEMIREEYMISETAFSDLEDLDEEDADFLQKFTFICLLNFDVYTKKLLIEKIVDSMKKPELPKNKRKR